MKFKKICLNCDREFEVYPYLKDVAKFCSRVCFHKQHFYWKNKERPGYSQFLKEQYRNGSRQPIILLKENNPSWKGGQERKNCEACNKFFWVYPYRKDARFCSNKCKGQLVKPMKGRRSGKFFNCKICNKSFYRHRALIEKGIIQYCSNKCWGKYLKEVFKDKTKTLGWKGGITPENLRLRSSEEYIIWRNRVFERDNYTCQKCGDSNGGNLEAHHKLPFAYFPESRFDVNNGQTLCKKCHKLTETYFRYFGKEFPKNLESKYLYSD